MAFNKSVYLQKVKLFALLGVGYFQNEEDKALAFAMFAYSKKMNAKPIYITEDTVLTRIDSGLYIMDNNSHATLTLPQVDEYNPFAVFVIGINNTFNVTDGVTTQFGDGGDFLLFVSPMYNMESIASCSSCSVIPIGISYEDLNIKESKGDDANLSFSSNITISKKIEANIPIFELLEYDIHSQGFNLFNIDGIVSRTNDIGKFLYICVVPDKSPDGEIPAYDGMVIKFNIQGSIKSMIEVVANQPNKFTLSFEKEVGINDSVLEILTV